MAGVTFTDTQTAASPFDDEGNPQDPIGQINCETGEALQ